MKGQNSPFKFLGFYIKNSAISINNPVDEKTFDIEVSASGKYLKQSAKFELTLSLNVEGEGKSFSARVEAVGNYEFQGDSQGDDLSNFFFINSPAILFPYLRAYVSSLSSLSGIRPVNIPTLNLTSLSQVLKENTEVVE